MTENNTAPKAFISYSWTTPAHEQWVIEFAASLREDGVNVTLDKWDLKEGHDGHAFMEQMVSDVDIKKVIIICDKGYVAKADKRSGGVGTETQIITPEIYEEQAQDKFVAVVMERHEDGKPYLPAFYGSRIYIDFSDDSSRAENYDRLLRWIFDKPLHHKPPLGHRPAFLTDDVSDISLATSSRFRRAVDALRNNRDNASALVEEYLLALGDEFGKLRIINNEDQEFDDLVVESIELFLPYRNEIISVFILLARNKNTEETIRIVRLFFERLIPYLTPQQGVHQYRERDCDNFKFIVHELYLYAIACFINHERFHTASALMSEGYYCPKSSYDTISDMHSFEIFRQYMPSLKCRNDRLKLSRLSLRADLLEQRSKESGVEFRKLMQADFILLLRDHLDRPGGFPRWWPETLLYASREVRTFEIFARSQSARYFEQVKGLLGVEDKDSLGALLGKINSDVERNLPRWETHSIKPTELIGYDSIATMG